jgi:hypothetical protein
MKVSSALALSIKADEFVTVMNWMFSISSLTNHGRGLSLFIGMDSLSCLWGKSPVKVELGGPRSKRTGRVKPVKAVKAI